MNNDDANKETPEQAAERTSKKTPGPAPAALKAAAPPAPQPAADESATLPKSASARELASPTHPAHAAFNWGKFFAIMTTALAVATPEIQIFTHNPKVLAAITGAEQIMGTVADGFKPAA